MKNLEATVILDKMEELFPNAKCELKHKNNYEMCIAVILSAQTTDKSVNQVTPNLFKKYPTLESLSKAKVSDIEKEISTLGLKHNKAISISGFAKKFMSDYNGKIPKTMDELVGLPGVGRKCANVILGECFGVPSLAVDTHVSRVSRRLGLAYQNDSVEKIEKKLKKKIPEERWIQAHHTMIFFGRYLCHAQKPECFRCPFVENCHEKAKNMENNSKK